MKQRIENTKRTAREVLNAFGWMLVGMVVLGMSYFFHGVYVRYDALEKAWQHPEVIKSINVDTSLTLKK